MTTATISGSIIKYSFGSKPAFIAMGKEDIERNPEYGYLFIQAHTFEVEINPDFDERKAKIEALAGAALKIRKEFNAKVEKINTEISKLQAIGYEDGQHSESVSDIVDTQDDFDNRIPF